MESIIIESNGEKLNGNKVRYICFEKENYFIYTLNEIDAEQYQKLYINKIVDNEEETITDLEWEDFKKKIPIIVKQIRSNDMNDVEDLDINLVNKINMKYSRAFKLKNKIVNSIVKQKTSDTIKQIDEDLKSIMDDFDSIQEKQNSELDYIKKLGNEISNKEDNEVLNSNIETPVNPNLDKQNKTSDNSNDLENKKIEELEQKIKELEDKVKKYEDKLENIRIMINES